MRVRLMFVTPLSILLLFLLLVGSFPPQGASSQLVVPFASSAEADGYIKPGEYDDALEVDLSNDTWEGYLYLKHDGEYLYVFLDHVSDTIHHPAGYDNGWVAIDSLSDGGNAPKDDDYLFHSSGHHVYVGDTIWKIPDGLWAEVYGHGDPPEEFEEKHDIFHEKYTGSGPGAFGRSAKSLTPHAIFEIQIPIWGWEFEDANWTVGFCAAAGSPGTQGDYNSKIVWPETAYANFTGDYYSGGVRTVDPFVTDPEVGSFPSPSTWGTITLSEVTAPPPDGLDYLLIIGIIIVVAAVIIIAVVILKRRK